MVPPNLPIGCSDATRRGGGRTDKLDGVLPEWTEDSFAGILLNVAAGRVANRFDFGGVNFTVDAACASSLAAVYLAVRDLEAGRSDVVDRRRRRTRSRSRSAIPASARRRRFSPGRCRTFDDSADGIAISEGFATSCSSASPTPSATATASTPSSRASAAPATAAAKVDRAASRGTDARPRPRLCQKAGFAAATVGLFEAHGTGTVAGDSSELESLVTLAEAAGAWPATCALGSVKSMIGHTKCTAGFAGLIKAALALHHKVLPPTLGVTKPNSKAKLDESPSM